MFKKHFSLFLAILSAGIILSSCNRGGNSVSEELPEGMHGVSVIEVVQTSNYTYLQVLENSTKYWIAITAREVKPGDVLYYTDALEMKDFHSKELNRDFPLIYFVQDPSTSPDMGNNSKNSHTTAEQVSGIEIEHVEGGSTLAEIFSNKDKYSEKKVLVRGLVVKFNKNIMGKNWVHIQDGTGDGKNYDLTITTQDVVKTGDIATFEGTVYLNRDFGSGYAYDIIMEEAKATDIKSQQPE